MSVTRSAVSGFHHLAFRASDFEATVAFYTKGLGCRETTRWGQTPKRAVMLDTGDGSYIEIFEGGQAGAKPEGALLHFALRTADCDAAFRSALAAGAKSTMEPQDITVDAQPSPFKIRIAFCVGLAGETLEFFQQKG